MEASNDDTHLPVQGVWKFNPSCSRDQLVEACIKLKQQPEYISSSLLQSSECAYVIAFDVRLRYANNRNIAQVMKDWTDSQVALLKKDFGNCYYGKDIYLEVWTSDKA